MQYYNLSHGKDGYKLSVGNKSVWRTAVTRLAGKIDVITGDVWCSGLPGNWFWEHSFGRRVVEEDGYVPNSINGKLLDSFNWVCNIEWRGEEELLNIPITAEQAKLIDVEFVETCINLRLDNAAE